jgi:hypothetical protein
VSGQHASALSAADAVREIACQQILQRDASVYSVQWMDFPSRYAQLIGAPQLLERYLRLVREFTFSIIRPVVSAEGIEFRLFGSSLAVLSFAAPTRVCGPLSEELHLFINGGLLVQARQCDRGQFSFLVERGEGDLRVTVQLSDYCPLLLGNSKPSRLRRLFYRLTQAYLHRMVTVKFLSCVYRELTGEQIRPRVNKVWVREGQET